MESQVSGLAKFGSRKSMDLPNLDLESHAMTVTCIIKLIILQTTHNIIYIAHIIIHITHTIVYIIRSYAMRHWNTKNEGSTYGNSTRESALANTESASFIHT